MPQTECLRFFVFTGICPIKEAHKNETIHPAYPIILATRTGSARIIDG